MTKIAKLFRNGNSQAVRLPQEMRFKGNCVRIRKVGDTVVMEPVTSDVKEWLAELRQHPLSRTSWQEDVINRRRQTESCLNEISARQQYLHCPPPR